MIKNRTLLIALFIAVVCVLGLNLLGTPSRVTDEDQRLRDKVAIRLDKIVAEEVAADNDLNNNASAPTGTPDAATEKKDDDMWPETAPDTFKVKFECTNGEFTVECFKEWAPLGVERFYQLVREGYFDDTGFFRVVPNFVVQFGLAADPQVTAKWRTKSITDDPVKQTNAPGTITFATSGPNSRTTQLFINLVDNKRLDGMGFSPFGKVIEGMDVVKKINPEYGERPQQGMITAEGNAYLKKNFPKMDFIKKATLVK